jgi:hypothetical protein
LWCDTSVAPLYTVSVYLLNELLLATVQEELDAEDEHRERTRDEDGGDDEQEVSTCFRTMYGSVC